MTHHDTGRTGRSISTLPRSPLTPRSIHREVDEIVNGGSKDESDDPLEFVVSVEISDVCIVRAASAEEALAKAVTGNPEGSDLDIEVVTHDVHACVHTGDDPDEHEGDGEE